MPFPSRPDSLIKKLSEASGMCEAQIRNTVKQLLPLVGISEDEWNAMVRRFYIRYYSKGGE